MVELESVSRVYSQGGQAVHALREVSLRVPRGQLLAVTGPSGSGKSTLLNVIGALDRPSSGMVRVDGRELQRMSEDEQTTLRRDRIGFVFQFFNLLPTMSSIENVMLPALLAGKRPGEVRARASSLLERVGLAHRRDARPDTLSGGEMQRVAVARALIMDPPLLLADEPTGNLDAASSSEVLRLLREATDKGARTVLVVTHDPRVAALADRLVRLQDGAVEEDRLQKPEG
ncbi:MAG: ABC transporter ATP-binding protein [Deltaproteobacteria bacterium]|nr:ABC transporter ATP-binding protein [Deltaproteobacteria bacterium]